MKKASELGSVRKVQLHKFIMHCIQQYGRAVITDRVVADFRDGLKPVQRRVLWSCYELNAVRKNYMAAAIVGHALGNYHPHGDAAAFDAAVKLASSVRYPLIHGEGNWGDVISGDKESAMRYISGRLSPLGVRLFKRAAIFDMIDNYSGTKKEPLYINTIVPLLLMNGVSGIAVGITVTMPPHNIKNLVKALVYLIKEGTESVSVKDIVKRLRHPDYIHGGVLTSSLKDILNVYETGRGTLAYRCEYHYEETKEGYQLLVIDSAAPHFSTAKFKEKIADFVKSGYLETWYEEVVKPSDKEPHKKLRICIGFTNTSFIRKKVLPLLNTHVSYSFAYVKNVDEERTEFATGNIKEVMAAWVDAQRENEAKWIKYQLSQRKAELFKVETRLKAIDHINVIADALKSQDPDAYLMKRLKMTKEAAEYILGVKVRTLSRLNRKALKEEQASINRTIKRLNWELKHIDEVICRKLIDLAKDLGDPMRTKLERYVEQAELPESTASVVIAGKKSGELWLDSSRIRKKADFICATDDKFIVVLRSGTYQMLDSITLAKAESDIAAILAPRQFIALIDEGGKLLLTECPDSGSARPVWLMKTDSRVKKAVTFDKKDVFVLRTPRLSVEFTGKDILELRRSPKTKGTFYKGKKVVDIYAVPRKSKEVICDERDDTGKFGLGSENVLLLNSGVRRYRDLAGSLKVQPEDVKDVVVLKK